ncbi:uncharacterized protein [Littorina saxatilis]|uniref:uncharacterized protein n=1 Tax=Littorina saxatilis TaxID=31220 RepID=UPI0038B4B323
MAEGGREATPSSTTTEEYIWEFRQENRDNNDYPLTESGKWMMFYALRELDEAWERARDMYRSGQLPSICGMKVSTAYPSPENRTNQGVLIFYCGPASDKNKMLAIGRDVAEKMRYGKAHIAYKTDAQTLQGIKGSIYTIQLDGHGRPLDHGRQPDHRRRDHRRDYAPKSRSDCPVWPRGCKP